MNDLGVGQLYRDSEGGMILGVCAGIADFFEIDVWIVRILAVCSLCFFTIVTGLCYLALGFFLRDKPLTYKGEFEEQEFWRRSSRGGHDLR